MIRSEPDGPRRAPAFFPRAEGLIEVASPFRKTSFLFVL